jgi:hypothetical protein
LNGQDGVFARRDISKGTFIGWFGAVIPSNIRQENLIGSIHKFISHDSENQIVGNPHKYNCTIRLLEALSNYYDSKNIVGISILNKCNTARLSNGEKDLYRNNLSLGYRVITTDTGQKIAWPCLISNRDISRKESLCYDYYLAHEMPVQQAQYTEFY